MQNVVVVGFPKCGTSALVRAMSELPGAELLTSGTGALEMGANEIDEVEAAHPQTADFRLHKRATYIYTPSTLRHLAETPRTFVVCIRSPVSALISWHKMHKAIAISGKDQSHFAWKERDFYADCSLEDYYGTFASDRLKYDLHLGRLLKLVSLDKIVVVSQERMAQDIAAVARFCLGVDGSARAAPHVSLSDDSHDQVPPTIREILDFTGDNLRKLIVESGVKAMI